MWKYMKGVTPPKKRKADDEIRQLEHFNYRGYMVGHGYDTIKLSARCIVM